MYRSSNNLNIKKERFSNIEEFEKFLSDPFVRVVEILKYEEINAYGDTGYILLGVEATVVIDNNVEY